MDITASPSTTVLRRPVYKALHRPLTICGVDRRLFFLALLMGAARTADVVAVTPLTVLELSKDDYERYLAGVAHIDDALRETAAARIR